LVLFRFRIPDPNIVREVPIRQGDPDPLHSARFFRFKTHMGRTVAGIPHLGDKRLKKKFCPITTLKIGYLADFIHFIGIRVKLIPYYYPEKSPFRIELK